MHEINERGVAAHWAYKEKDSSNGEYLTSIAWMADLIDILQKDGATDEFLENSSMVECLKVLRITTSLIFEITLATSETFSLFPKPTSSGEKYISFIPLKFKAFMKLSLVLKEGFSNNKTPNFLLSLMINFSLH